MTALLAEKPRNVLIAMHSEHKWMLERLAPEASNRVVSCAAHLINYFSRFQDWKQPRYQSRWIYQPLRKISLDLAEMYTLHTLRAAIDLLQNLGFLSVSRNHRATNWRNGQDKTHQYLLHRDRIELELENFRNSQETTKTPEKSPFAKIEPSDVRIEPSDVETESSRFTDETTYTYIHLITNNNSNSLKGERGGDFDIWSDEEEEESPRQDVLDCTEKPKLLEEFEGTCDNNLLPGVSQFSAATSTSKQVEVIQKSLPKLKGNETSHFSSTEEREGFYQALLELGKNKSGIRSPVGWASQIIKGIEAGEPCEYLNEFRRGDVLGLCEKREWEIAPGKPYPQLVTYLKRRLRTVKMSEEEAISAAHRELGDPNRAADHWESCKRTIVNLKDEWEKQQALGVANAYIPPELLPEKEVLLEEAASSMQVLQSNSVQFNSSFSTSTLPAAAEQQVSLFPAGSEEPATEQPPAEEEQERPALTDLQVKLESSFSPLVRLLVRVNRQWGYHIDPELKLVLPVDGQPPLEYLQWLIGYSLTASRARKLIERNPQWGFVIDETGMLMELDF